MKKELLEVGMYVRTKKGIFQIRNKDVFIEDKKQYIGVNGRYTCIDIETIIKASHNIIDLIEIGDYVNGYKIVGIDIDDFDEYSTNKKYIVGGGKEMFEEEIETIVTKEQFEAMQYEVK